MGFRDTYSKVYGTIYTVLQRLLHRFNLHYMPPSYPDGDTMIWCHWCGARDVINQTDTATPPLLTGWIPSED